MTERTKMKETGGGGRVPYRQQQQMGRGPQGETRRDWLAGWLPCGGGDGGGGATSPEALGGRRLPLYSPLFSLSLSHPLLTFEI